MNNTLSYIRNLPDFVTTLFTVSIILVITVIISRIIYRGMGRFMTHSTAKLKVDPTTFNFLKNAITSLIWILAITLIFYSIPQLRSLGLTLFAGAGIFAAILGFASQQAFSNIISGVFIVLFKPFRVDDMIRIGVEHVGKVEDITLRHTVIRNFENRRIIIPNSIISSETIINSSIVDDKVCVFLELGISYDSDVDTAIKIIQIQAQQHPDFLDNRTPEQIEINDPAVVVRLVGFGDSSVNLRAYIWTHSADTAFRLKCDLHQLVKAEFDRCGIEIPFPYRTIVFKNGSANLAEKSQEYQNGKAVLVEENDKSHL